MKIGFTGSRKGMTPDQKDELEFALASLMEHGAKQFHHGDCIGADEEAHIIARCLGLEVIIHPPTDDKLRAYCDSDLHMIQKPYLQRNRCIVDSCDILIAAPRGPERLRSGTWSTVRYASKQGKEIQFVGLHGD